MAADQERCSAFDAEAFLERIGGFDEMVREILELTLEHVPELMQSLREAMDAGNLEEGALKAHTLKGTAANIEAQPLRESALSVEMALKDGDIAAAERSFAELSTRYEELARAIRGHLESL